MLKTEDKSKEVIEWGTEVPLDLEKIAIRTDSSIKIALTDWEKAGLRISVSVNGIGNGYFNEQPYSDRETALKKFQQVLAQVQNGNYSLELYENNKLKLILIDSA